MLTLLFMVSSFTHYSAISVSIDNRTPIHSNGPGWIVSPKSVSALPGQHVELLCQNELANISAVWLVNGRTNVLDSKSKFRLKATVTYERSGMSRLQYGPIQTNDSGLTFSCEVVTAYGPIPSPLATITVLGESDYTQLLKTVYLKMLMIINCLSFKKISKA